jgi:hypothetical protein
MAASSADSAREEPPPPVRRGARQQAALGTHAVPAAGIAGTVVELGMAGSVAAVGGGAALGFSFLSRLYHSVSPLPPTEAQLATEDLDSCPIFRHIPELRGRVAFREIGENYPTPIHSVTVDGVSFLVKREDLSSATYGGNKVRTLQHQLASCEAHLDTHPDATFTVVGSSGSNQSVATTVHGMRCFVSAIAHCNALRPSLHAHCIHLLNPLVLPVVLCRESPLMSYRSPTISPTLTTH